MADLPRDLDICNESVNKQPILLCDPCKSQNKTNSAILFCSECENELLCNDCANTHRAQKLTKLHMLKDISKLEPNDTEAGTNYPSLLCEPCSNQDKTKVAVLFCVDCENELLCNDCANTHKAQKLTKLHILQDISKLEPNEDEASTKHSSLFCEPCSFQDTKNVAVLFCPECENELFCNDCANTHRAQKKTKTHVLEDVSIFVSNEEKEKPSLCCEPCFGQEKYNSAVLFCPECENELLCSKCANTHKTQKATRAHLLQDICNFVQKDESAAEKLILLCGPCECQGKQTTAVFYCLQCEKELLCCDCAKCHRAQRMTKEHVLEDACNFVSNEGLQKADESVFQCEPCDGLKKHSLAALFCPDCDNELLCKECANNHKVQKLTKNHVLQSIGNMHPGIGFPSEVKLESNHSEERESANGNLTSDSCITGTSDGTITQNEICIIKSDKDTQDDSQRPGKPKALNVDVDTVTLTWTAPEIFSQDDYFQIGYKDCLEGSRWKFCNDKCTNSTHILTNLKSDTEFVFRVRAVYSEIEGPYSETSEVITTKLSPAFRLVEQSELCYDKKFPHRYKLPMVEIKDARNEKAKSKKFELRSNSNNSVSSKTMLLIGETGTGKSTLVDAIVNYILGVNWDDSFRFTIGTLDDERKDENQAKSQTEWITCYTFHPQNGSRLQYSINIIDTPGFGDTRGLERDQEIVEQIRQLFRAEPPQGLMTIDIVCCTVKAPDARLTTMQNYVFNSVMSLFGKDIEKNICSLITFADSKSPPVLAALQESGLPFGKHFTFNNTALFEENANNDIAGPTPKSFWDMGVRSFANCFHHISQMRPESLQLTKEVLEERYELDSTLQKLQPKLDTGLLKISQLKLQMKLFQDNKAAIDANKEFTYIVKTETHSKEPLKEGLHTTNCMFCNVTCHDNCSFANDEDKMKCVAMDPSTGHCKVCKNNCIWSKHVNSPFIFKYIVVDETKTYSEMKSKYEDACNKKLTLEQVLVEMGVELNEIADTIEEMMDVVRMCNSRLGEIALCPNPLSMTQHIDIMIQNEKSLKKAGWVERIEALFNLRKRAEAQKDAERFRREAGGLGITGGTTDPKAVLKRFHDLFGF